MPDPTPNPNLSDADYDRAVLVAASVRPMADVLTAALALAEIAAIGRTFDDMVLTCDEAEAVYQLLYVCGYRDAADRSIVAHVPDDSETDRHHALTGWV